MAISHELLAGTTGLRPQERVEPVVTPKPKRFFTPSEICQMSLITPEGLTPDNPIETPAGIWHQEGNHTFFDFKSAEELAKIRVPEAGKRRRQRLIRAAKFITQVG